ncbi:MAG: hypothetical protein JWM42_1165 [Burkholderia sp.]|nr:hypothetical protein [Burkholderia sp.]
MHRRAADHAHIEPNIALRHAPVKSRRVFQHIAFAFLLLLSQQLGMAHAVSHLSSDAHTSTEKKQLPSELQCGQCLTFAALGTGLTGSSSFVIFVPASADTAIAALPARPLSAALLAFESRAPPALA